MSTNYNILLKSEKQLKKNIVEYLELVHKIHFKLWNHLLNDEEDDFNTTYDNTERRVKQALLMEDELIDECVWTISKDDPRANHLRFIISVIYCAKDLTRAAEYAQSMIKMIIRKKIEKKYLKLIKPSADLYIKTIQEIIKIYNSSIDDRFEKVEELYSQFESKLEENEKTTRKKFKEEGNNEIVYIYISQITRLINSTIERIKSVFPSTMFVKSSTSSISTIQKKK